MPRLFLYLTNNCLLEVYAFVNLLLLIKYRVERPIIITTATNISSYPMVNVGNVGVGVVAQVVKPVD